MFSGVVAVSTLVYAALTWYLVRETRLMRHAQTTPKVAVFYRNRDEWISLLDVVVKNIGLGPAYDVSFQLGAEPASSGADALLADLQERNLFSSGVRFLAPGQEYSSYFTNVTEKFEEKMAARIRILVRYRAASGNRYTDEYTIDLSEIRGMVEIGKPPLLEIAKHTEQIAKALTALSSGTRRLKTDTYDSEDRAAERARSEAWLEDARRRQKESQPPTEGSSQAHEGKNDEERSGR